MDSKIMTIFDNKLKQIDKLQKEIDSIRPITIEEIKQLKEYYRIGLTYSSNAIEGNSLTESETKIILEDGITIGGKTLKDHLEVVGHSDAYDYILQLSKNKTIKEKDIKKLHRLFYRKIDETNAGKYRKVRVFITGSAFNVPPPSKIKELMIQFTNDIDRLRNDNHPVIYSALLHKHLVMIHPFIDGNGRTARLLMNLALLQEGYHIIIIPPILRNEYISSLEQCHKNNDTNFIKLIVNAVLESQRDYLRLFHD